MSGHVQVPLGRESESRRASWAHDSHLPGNKVLQTSQEDLPGLLPERLSCLEELLLKLVQNKGVY